MFRVSNYISNFKLALRIFAVHDRQTTITLKNPIEAEKTKRLHEKPRPMKGKWIAMSTLIGPLRICIHS